MTRDTPAIIQVIVYNYFQNEKVRPGVRIRVPNGIIRPQPVSLLEEVASRMVQLLPRLSLSGTIKSALGSRSD